MPFQSAVDAHGNTIYSVWGRALGNKENVISSTGISNIMGIIGICFSYEKSRLAFSTNKRICYKRHRYRR